MGDGDDAQRQGRGRLWRRRSDRRGNCRQVCRRRRARFPGWSHAREVALRVAARRCSSPIASIGIEKDRCSCFVQKTVPESEAGIGAPDCVSCWVSAHGKTKQADRRAGAVPQAGLAGAIADHRPPANHAPRATATYLALMVKPMGITVSRLASGLPVGGDLEYADEVTLGRAFEGRRLVD